MAFTEELLSCQLDLATGRELLQIRAEIDIYLY